MYFQFDYDTEPTWWPNPPEEDEDERRHRIKDEEEWHLLTSLSTMDDLPF